jgi:hypothetical protein
LARFPVESEHALEQNAGMNEDGSATRSYALAIIMERTALTNRWVSEKWEAKGIIGDNDSPGMPPRVILQRDGLTQVLHPGHHLSLKRDEAEGYFLNLTSPQPKVFVLWRWVDDTARPERITVSYGEGTRWADSGEQVDGVPLPAELVPWIAEFVEAHYRPEPPKKKRYASNKDKGRMGRLEG